MINNIEKRSGARGNSSAVLHFGIPLSSRQKFILNLLREYDSRCLISRKKIKLSDLSALTAATGDEFAMFTKGKTRLIIRGNKTSVNVSKAYAKLLCMQGYRWSGHTHPRIDDICLMPSDGDKEVLNEFKQNNTAIYNSIGKWYILEKGELL